MTPEEQRQLISGLRGDALNRYLSGDESALRHSVAMNPDDKAFWMLTDGHRSTPVVHRRGCYICEDPEFAVMGLPLCRPCPWKCGPDGHCPADDEGCDNCGGSERLFYELTDNPAAAPVLEWARAYFGDLWKAQP